MALYIYAQICTQLFAKENSHIHTCMHAWMYEFHHITSYHIITLAHITLSYNTLHYT